MWVHSHLLGPLCQQCRAAGQTGPRCSAAEGRPQRHRLVKQLLTQPGETFIAGGGEEEEEDVLQDLFYVFLMDLIKLKDLRVFGGRVRSVVSWRFGGRDKDRVLAFLGLVQLQQPRVFGRLPFNLQRGSNPGPKVINK